MAPGSERVPGGDGGLRATFPGAKVQMQTERSSVSSICETVARVDHEEVAYPLPTPYGGSEEQTGRNVFS